MGKHKDRKCCECLLYKYFAKGFDMHINNSDCPYNKRCDEITDKMYKMKVRCNNAR